jgi:hypothetical protein
MTKCPKCEQQGFELVEGRPSGTDNSLVYLRCSHCKTFLQAMYAANTNIMVDNLHKDIKKIKEHLGIIS